MARPFQFKQFQIYQDKCAMKVGTDGVLLGAWVNVKKAKTILDIGTGTGLIALMLAQRNKKALIKAIEIDRKAAWQAEENFKNSSWKNRLEIESTNLQKFAITSKQKFDVIVSNPPFYQNHKFTVAKGDTRSMARNTHTLSFKALVENSIKLMHEKSILAIIIPIETFDELNEILVQSNLFINHKMIVQPTLKKLPHRILLEASFQVTDVNEETLIIQNQKRNDFTDDYIQLTQDFYTIM